ncbi:unnamed protein product [marine sediment metagenome]|uniref:Ribbon-helix-helix protein CopG domain-containing protein n=1 Tax=marine sediment metagenome TaxID=412755 RepID=X1IFV4_9ZZZZ
MSDKMVKKVFSVTLPGPYVKALDCLVKGGIYMDPQAAIRNALRRLFQYHGIKTFTDKGVKLKTKDDPPKCED